MKERIGIGGAEVEIRVEGEREVRLPALRFGYFVAKGRLRRSVG